MVTTVVVKRGEQTAAISPLIDQAILWLPIRALIEGLGGQVQWDEARQVTTITLGGSTLEVVLGQTAARLNGNTVTLFAAPRTQGNRSIMTWYDLTGFLPIQLQWIFEPIAPLQPLSGVSLCIDPGHGGSDPGAQGPTGLLEKDVNLSVGLQLRDLLVRAGARVVMTRTSDLTVSLASRADLANTQKVEWFVSIHCNSATPQAHGIETYSYPSDVPGGQLAAAVQGQLASALGLTDRGVKTETFYVLKNTSMPAILTELAFISNPDEERLLALASTRQTAAQAIYRGILATVVR